jgi:hypothetical protein
MGFLVGKVNNFVSHFKGLRKIKSHYEIILDFRPLNPVAEF